MLHPMFRHALALLLLLLLAPSPSAAAPLLINHEGLLLDQLGLPMEGEVELTFTIHALPAGGASLWSERVSLELIDGYYSLQLGKLTPLDGLFDGGEPRYLSISVDGVQLQRLPLVSVPYAISAQNVTGDITPKSIRVQNGGITVGNQPVINGLGEWVGPAVPGAADGVGYDTPEEVVAALSGIGTLPGVDADQLDGQHAAAFLLEANLQARLLQLDGAGSLLDADLLDGKQLADLVQKSEFQAQLQSHATGEGSGVNADRLDGLDSSQLVSKGGLKNELLLVDGSGSGLDADLLDGKQLADLVQKSEFSAQLQSHATGNGSGVDADRLDGQDSSAFVTKAGLKAELLTVDGTGSLLDADLLDGKELAALVQKSEFQAQLQSYATGNDSGVDADRLDGLDSSQLVTRGGLKAELLALDGSGSLLDADLLDGRDIAALVQKVEFAALLLAADGSGSGLDADRLDGLDSSQLVARSGLKAELLALDGPGSELGADLLDDLHASAFLRNDLAAAQATQGDLRVGGALQVAGNLDSAGRLDVGGDLEVDGQLRAGWVRVRDGAKVGVGVDPAVELDVAGTIRASSGIQIGRHDAPCNGEKAGLLRYNGAAIEFCNGAEWLGIGSAGTDDGSSPQAAGTSCEAILSAGLSRGSGLYWIDPLRQGADAAYQVYCEMSYGGGGWTLAMKSNANNADFHYNSNHWTQATTLNPNSFGLVDGTNAKYASFNQLPVWELLIVAQNGQHRVFTLSSARKGRTLLELTSAPFDTSDANAETLENIQGIYYNNSYLYPDVVLDGHEHYICHRLAFNSTHYNDSASGRARIGYAMSQEYGCGHPGTAEGLGVWEQTYNHNVGSGRVQWEGNGEADSFRKALVYVRGEPSPAPPTEYRSCMQIHLAEPAAPSGSYSIDPDGVGGGAPFRCWCDMSSEGGGWTLVMKVVQNNGDFYYSSPHWTESTVFNSSDFTLGGGLNAKYASFNWVPMERLMLVAQNGQVRTFTLTAGLKGRTLLDLTSAAFDLNGNGETVEADYLSGPWATSYLFPDVTLDGHERFVCQRLAFNSTLYSINDCHGRFRIGYTMSQEYPCGHPGTGEGVGLWESCQNDHLNSGRLQWASETNYFRQVLVYVQ